MGNPRTPSAAWSAKSLLNHLARHGWGILAGGKWQGQRSVLMALVEAFPGKAAEGKVTAPQIADRAGLSERHTRTLLNELEDLGLIAWRRGGIRRGVPTPSYIQIVKTRLAEICQLAFTWAQTRWADRRAAWQNRLIVLRAKTNKLFPTVKGDRRAAGKLHAELCAVPLSTSRGRRGKAPRTPSPQPKRKETKMIAHAYSPACDCMTCYSYRQYQEQVQEAKARERASALALKMEEARRAEAEKRAKYAKLIPGFEDMTPQQQCMAVVNLTRPQLQTRPAYA